MKKVISCICVLLFVCSLAIAAEVTPPQPIRQVPPVTTKAMKEKGLTGVVIVEFFIEADGSVGDATATQSPAPELSEAAVSCVKQWKFKPATVDKKPVRQKTAVSIAFAGK